MIKKTQNISINIFTTVILLLGVLLLSIGSGNAWFSTSQDRSIIVIGGVGEFNVSLYQITNVSNQDVSTEVYTYKKNEKVDTTSYITLKDALQPEEFIDLKLNLVNNDAGSAVYFRYKLELYACGSTADTLIPIRISLGEKFKQGNDGFYNYVDSNNNKILFAKDNSAVLLTGFTIPYNNFDLFEGSDTVKIVLTLEFVDQANVF